MGRKLLDVCDKYGILSFTQTIYTQIPTSGTSNTFKITNSFPTDIGLVYGLAIVCDGVKADAAGQNVIDVGKSILFWLNIKVASTAIMSTWRLDQLAYIDPVGSGLIINSKRYADVFLPGSINWEQSFYSNPTNDASGNWIALDFKYIDPTALEFLIRKKEIEPYSTLKAGYAKK